MDAELLVQSGFLVAGLTFFGVWVYKNVWHGPKVTKARVIERTSQVSGTRLPDILPGTGGVFNAATTNILVLEIDGMRQRYTANDEAWKRARVGDRVKVWIQHGTHIVGVYVLSHEEAEK